MAITFQKTCAGVRYEVRTAGRSVRLYTNGAFHSQYPPNHLFASAVLDLLSLPSLSADRPISEALILGVGGGSVIHQLDAMHRIKRIVGIELDPMHLQIGKTLFNLSYTHTKLVNAGALEWLIGQQSRIETALLRKAARNAKPHHWSTSALRQLNHAQRKRVC